jgi:molybdenum cofactor cytidylyltransferase
LAVVRVDDSPLQHCLQQAGIETVVNPRADRGMGGSLACAVAASSSGDGWCILPADMPFITPETVERVVTSLRRGAAIALPCFRGQRGHPVGFSRIYRERLLALQGDRGARSILADEPRAIVQVPTEDAGILQDIDTPQDLQALKS